MKRIIRLTESDLTRIVKRIIMEEQCSAPPQWLMNYQLDGKLGKAECSNWEWRKDTYTFLFINPKVKILILSINPNEIEEDQLNELKQIFGEPKITEKYYTFKYTFSNQEDGGDLNQTLDRLQGKVPWISSLNESDIRRILENAFTKMRRRDGEPIVRKTDLVKGVIHDLSMKMSKEYGLDEYEGDDNIPEYLMPYLDEISEVVSNIDTMLIWDAVYESLDTPEINDLIDKIVDEYGEDN
jgi:hypothetical protein